MTYLVNVYLDYGRACVAVIANSEEEAKAKAKEFEEKWIDEDSVPKIVAVCDTMIITKDGKSLKEVGGVYELCSYME
jgi:hypothetical protein